MGQELRRDREAGLEPSRYRLECREHSSTGGRQRLRWGKNSYTFAQVFDAFDAGIGEEVARAIIVIWEGEPAHSEPLHTVLSTSQIKSSRPALER